MEKRKTYAKKLYTTKWQNENQEKCKEASRKWREKNKEQVGIYVAVRDHERYPLDDKCFFCGITAKQLELERGQKLEHGHLDYKNEGFNYVTVCHLCNFAMETDTEMMKLAWDYIKGLPRRE